MITAKQCFPASHVHPAPGILLQCPRCRGQLVGLECRECDFELRVRDGIVDALPPERAERYDRFARDYRSIRMAEGRGSESADFYLALPYRDLTGRNARQWDVRARSFDCLTTRVLARTLREERGHVLDLGAGNCWMSYRLALAGYFPVALDLLVDDRDGLGSARHYAEKLPRMFPRFRAEMTRLPFHDRQFDAVIFNASFHYSENYEATLREALRCVRPAGTVIISDTPWYSREASGQQMVRERRAAFMNAHGTASDSVQSLEYLTDRQLRELEARLAIRWEKYSPHYGFRWAIRPLLAQLRGRREPSRFRIYAARKTA